jgi:diguanylate cyclase (GGDEF)-like protein
MRPDDRAHRTEEERESLAPSGLPLASERWRFPAGSHQVRSRLVKPRFVKARFVKAGTVCLTICLAVFLRGLLLFGVLFGVLAPAGAAQERPATTSEYVETQYVQTQYAQTGPAEHSGLLSVSAIGPASEGHLQFVSSANVVGVNPARSQARTIRPQPLIEQVRFNQRLLSFEQGVTADPGGGDLEIQFAAPESVDPDRVHFRYRLIGFALDWTEAGKEREAIYTGLPPGHYLFELEETDGGNVREPRIASLGINVIPYYWQTGWFRTLCGTLLFVLSFALYFLRVRYLVIHAHKIEEKLNQRTGELHLAVKVAKDAQSALKELAMKDSLTNLWNRRVIFEMLEREVSRAQRDHLPIAVVMIDLDHFKNVNDTYGHLTGDAVLQVTAKRIAELMRPYDFAGRYGGEEFLIVLPGCSAMNGIQRAEDFRRAIAETPVPTAAGLLTVTCSLGVASHDGVIPAEDLIHHADEALYRAKRVGRNCVRAGTEHGQTTVHGTA